MKEETEFFKIYSSIPLEERNNVVVVIDGEPISWYLAYQQIKNKGKKANKILKTLRELEII